MVLVKNWRFFHLFFKDNIEEENVFYDILEGEKAFLGYKNTKLKKPKVEIFPKGLVHGFGQKFVIFLSFFKYNIGQENVFCDIL